MNKPKDYIRWCMNAVATRFNRKIFSINLEVTKTCNARCKFCNYWKTKNETPLDDYLPPINHLDPLAITLTGGEPLLRQDITQIVKQIKKTDP